jgi:uncharacterized protein YbjT (DUF2867 family)
MYVICGATGNTGTITARQLLKNGKQVRVIGRDAEKLKSLVEQGAEAAVGSLEDNDFVKQALSNATAAYLMIPPNFAAGDFRAYQKKVGQNLAAAAKSSGLKHAVTLSSIGGDLDAGTGPVLGLHWMEEALNAVPDLNVLHLRPTFFMENLFSNIPLIKGNGMNGMPAPGDVPMTMIATKDIGDYAAKRLLALDFTGSDFQDLVGPPEITMSAATTLLGKAIGKSELPYVQFSYEDAKQGMIGSGLSEQFADLYIELYKGFASGTIKSARPRDAESTTPTTFEEFSKTFAAVYNS